MLEVGGTHVTAAWVEPDGWRVSGASRHELRADASGEQLLAGLVAAAAGLSAGPGAGWGIAMPGPFDYPAGIAHYTGVGKFEGLTGVDVRSALYELLPERPGFDQIRQRCQRIPDRGVVDRGGGRRHQVRGADLGHRHRLGLSATAAG